MEYLGQTQTATYMTGPRLDQCDAPSFLPTIAVNQSGCKPYDTYPHLSPVKNYQTVLPWKAAVYYQSTPKQTSVPNLVSTCEPERNRLTQMDTLCVPPLFASARNSLYSRYTSRDWMASNLSNQMASQHVRAEAERLRDDTALLCKETAEQTSKSQEDSGQKLAQRINDIEFWKQEAENELDNMLSETKALHRAKCCLEKTMEELKKILKIDEECLYEREKRRGIDLVHDAVEYFLIREVDAVKRIQNELKNLHSQTVNQLALNRAAQHELEKDVGNKFISLMLDSASKQLRNTSRGINFHDDVERIDNTNSIPSTWKDFSHNNIKRSQAERAASVSTRDQIESKLTASAELLLQTWNDVNNSLSDRIGEYLDARNKVQKQLSKVLQEIFDAEKNMTLIRKSLEDKESPMKVAQTRLNIRLSRPDVEACRDNAQHKLVEEVCEIRGTVDQLKQMLREADNALQHLLRSKCSLEHDLAIKNNSLFIDREKVLALRKTFPMSTVIRC